jgi:hypothetical protein
MSKKLDCNKLHYAELVKVKSIYRGEYEKQGLMFFFKINETEIVVHRTTCIPKTLHAKKTVFHDFINALTDKPLDESLFDKPNQLARLIENMSHGTNVGLKIEPSNNSYVYNITEIHVA